MKLSNFYLRLMLLALFMPLVSTFVSCDTSDSDEDMEKVMDDMAGDDQQDDGDPGTGSVLDDVTITVSDAYNICGFGTDIDVMLDGNIENVTVTGIALSESVQNLENEPQSWIYGIVDAPQPSFGLQTLHIKGLRGERTYYCRPFVTCDAGDYLWGEIKTFTTTEEILFGQKTGVSNISVRDAKCTVGLNAYSALESVYRKVEVSLQDVVLEDFQCSIFYYETVQANAEHYSATLNEDKISVSFTELPPGAKVSFLICVDCDGTKYISKERYTVTTRKISDSGVVNLSLSVDWAACNLGADLPWDTGSYYTYEEATQQAGNDNTWQLPTKENIEQLLSQCEILPVSFDNVRRGVLVSNGKNTICLPFAETKDSYIGDNGFTKGYFWTSTPYFDAASPLDKSRAYTFRLFGMTSPGDERYGLVELKKSYAISVRPVYPK